MVAAVKDVMPVIVKLDLACGKRKMPGFTGIDALALEGVDQVLDLMARDKKGFKPWPWADESVDEVNCQHFIEHLEQTERVHFGTSFIG